MTTISEIRILLDDLRSQVNVREQKLLTRIRDLEDRLEKTSSERNDRRGSASRPILTRQRSINPIDIKIIKIQIRDKLAEMDKEISAMSPDDINTNNDHSVSLVCGSLELKELVDALVFLPAFISE